MMLLKTEKGLEFSTALTAYDSAYCKGRELLFLMASLPAQSIL